MRTSDPHLLDSDVGAAGVRTPAPQPPARPCVSGHLEPRWAGPPPTETPLVDVLVKPQARLRDVGSDLLVAVGKPEEVLPGR